MSEVISGVASGILTAVLVAAAAGLWRWRLLRKYDLTNESRGVLEALWDEQLLRRSVQIARELGLSEETVLQSLQQSEVKRLARQRSRPTGIFWKITLRGKEYLRLRSWIEWTPKLTGRLKSCGRIP